MNEHKRLHVLKRIAGCLLLVTVLHYVFDQPTRRQLQLSFKRLNIPMPPPHRPPEHQLDHHDVENDQPLLGDASFERWKAQAHPIPRAWFSSVTIEVPQVVKMETDRVQDGHRALRLEHDGVGHCGNVRQELPSDALPSLLGRWVKFSVYALSAIPGAPCVHIDDGVGRSSGCLQNPSLAWEPVTVERMISLEATRVLLIIDISREATGETPASVLVDNASFTESLPPSEAPGATDVPALSVSPSPEQH